MLLFLLGFLCQVQAQSMKNPGTPEQRADKITQEMIKTLPLDSSQVDTVHSLNLKYAEKAQKEIIDQNMSKWSMLRKGQKLNNQKEKELKPLLSESQWKNYQKMKSAARGRMLKQM